MADKLKSSSSKMISGCEMNPVPNDSTSGVTKNFSISRAISGLKIKESLLFPLFSPV